MSLFIRGKIVGVKVQEFTNSSTGEVTGSAHYVGFEEPKFGGYDGEKVVRDVRISSSQVKSGIHEQYKKFVGREVQSELFVSSWASKTGKHGINYILSGDGIPRLVKSDS